MSKISFVRENFTLKSLIIKNGKCFPAYHYKHNDSKEKETREYTVKVPLAPHPDLSDLFLQLREYIAKDHYMDTDIETLERIEITQVLTAGEEEKRGIKFLGTLTTLHDCKVPIQTGIIRFEDDISGYEAELETIFDAIENESFEFIFNGKNMQPSLFDAEVVDAEIISGLNVPKLSKVS